MKAAENKGWRIREAIDIERGIVIMDKTVYTVAEVQKLLGIDRGCAYRLCNGQAFVVKKVGRSILIPIKSFNEWLYSDNKELPVSEEI